MEAFLGRSFVAPGRSVVDVGGATSSHCSFGLQIAVQRHIGEGFLRCQDAWLRRMSQLREMSVCGEMGGKGRFGQQLRCDKWVLQVA
jgi:hypothetical protein